MCYSIKITTFSRTKHSLTGMCVLKNCRTTLSCPNLSLRVSDACRSQRQQLNTFYYILKIHPPLSAAKAGLTPKKFSYSSSSSCLPSPSSFLLKFVVDSPPSLSFLIPSMLELGERVSKHRGNQCGTDARIQNGEHRRMWMNRCLVNKVIYFSQLANNDKGVE